MKEKHIKIIDENNISQEDKTIIRRQEKTIIDALRDKADCLEVEKEPDHEGRNHYKIYQCGDRKKYLWKFVAENIENLDSDTLKHKITDETADFPG